MSTSGVRAGEVRDVGERLPAGLRTVSPRLVSGLLRLSYRDLMMQHLRGRRLVRCGVSCRAMSGRAARCTVGRSGVYLRRGGIAWSWRLLGQRSSGVGHVWALGGRMSPRSLAASSRSWLMGEARGVASAALRGTRVVLE